MQISYLADPQGHPLWPDIERLLEPATEGEGLSANELVWLIYDGPTAYGAATTILYDDGTAQLRLAGGHRHREWAGLLSDTVSEWARDCGATKLFGRGRKGWRRYANELGWTVTGEESGRLNFEREL